MRHRVLIPLLLFAFVATGCQQTREPADLTAEPVNVAAEETAYHRALRVELADQKPENGRGLLNVHRLSDHIISGSEPENEEAFKRMAELGVKTILSVDGKAPDVEGARRHGMRYVHVPIQYRGITEDELLRIAKTFHELEAPFYVHCFHGKHRGPAAAAVGRVLLDGVSRDQALAEMRQWCGTSGKYEGLYQVIASRALPTRETTTALAWDFPSQVRFDGLRLAMVEMTRIHDHLKALDERDWNIDPNHPDLDPVHEASRLAELMGRAVSDACGDETESFRHAMTDMADEVRSLEALLKRVKKGDEDARIEASATMKSIKQSCVDCHRVYRNR